MYAEETLNKRYNMKTRDRQWTKEYWDFMMNENYEAGIKLKGQHFPQSFFKYRTLNRWTLDNLSKNTIWLAEISSLNDPFECSLQFDNDKCLRLFFADLKFQKTFKEKFGKELSQSEIAEIVNSPEPYVTYNNICKSKNIVLTIYPDKQLETIQKRWKQIIEETNRDIKVCSFSEFNDSLLMWSHYADQHKGICIEYDFYEEDMIRAFLQPVIYSDKVFKIGLFEELTTLRKIGSTLIKCKDWEYEAEWRLTIIRQREDFPGIMNVPNPKAVYLGTRFFSNNKRLIDELFQILEVKKIPVFQMVQHPEEYKLIKLHNKTALG